jgi:Flp pilus assembly pilin Flp
MLNQRNVRSGDLKRFWADENGQDLIEYALLCGLVATGTAILMPMSVFTSMTGIYSRVVVLLDRFGSSGG